MSKKPLFVLVAALAAVGGIVGMSAYEAYVVHVTANIENSMTVSTDAVDFGNVFPEEELISDSFTIAPSCSFNDQDRVNYIDYVIKQQPVPLNATETVYVCDVPEGGIENINTLTSSEYCLNYSKNEPGYRAIWDGQTDYCSTQALDYEWFCHPNLCPYLSKEVTGYPSELGGVDVPWNNRTEGLDYGISAFHDPADEDSWASGRVWLGGGDEWTIDLETPCYEGECGPDWDHPGYELPNYEDGCGCEGCEECEEECEECGIDLRCDLWIEVTEVGYSDED